VGIGLAVARVLARLGVAGLPRAIAAVGAAILASDYLLALGGGLTEPLATLMLAWALVLALGRVSAARTAGIGALVGLSILTSVQLLVAGLVVLSLVIFMRPAAARAQSAAMMAVGLLLPLAVTAAWLVVIGALPAALDAVVMYSTAYRESSAEYGAILAAPVAAWTALASLFLVAPALLGAASLPRIPRPARAVMVAALVWIVASLVLFVAQGRFYAHYAIPLAVPLGILAGFGLERGRESLVRARVAATKALIVGPLMLAVIVSIIGSIISGSMQAAPIADQSTRIEAVSERLGDLPAGYLLVWGNQPRLYDVAGRAPATRYSYLYPLTTPGYSTPAMIDEVARQLAATPPAVVVDAGSPAPGQPGFLPLLIARPIATDGRDLDLLDPLRTFVAANYRLASTVAGWPIYVLRSPAAGSQE
jgi:hypothetical protein